MDVVLWAFLLLSIFASGEAENCYYCPRASCQPTIQGIPNEQFNPATDAEDLRKAMKGPGTNEDTLITILTSRSEVQRQAIADVYITSAHNLATDIQDDTSFSFKKLLVALVTPLLTFYTRQLGEAIKHNDRNTVIEILTSLPPCVIRKMAVKYVEFYPNHNMCDDVKNFKISEAFRLSNDDYNNLMSSLAQGTRSTDYSVDEQKALEDAKSLKKYGVDKLGTKESIFVEIFTQRSIPQLAATFTKYEELRKQEGKSVTIEKDLESEFSGDMLDALLAIATYTKDQPMYFAIELNNVLDQWFKSDEDEEKLIRIIRGRCDIDLEDIKVAYEKKYKKSLYSVLEGKFNSLKSSYKKTLLAIVKAN